MLRLTRAHRFRISNRLAVFAAFLLLVAAAAGFSVQNEATAYPDNGIVKTQPADEATARTAAVRSNKGFKVSLYLFRRN